jgi:hypothetical protein
MPMLDEIRSEVVNKREPLGGYIKECVRSHEILQLDSLKIKKKPK